jgi:hypothetical protein
MRQLGQRKRAKPHSTVRISDHRHRPRVTQTAFESLLAEQYK